LEIDLERLGNAATASPQSDIAKQGLKLLVEHYPVKKSLGLLHGLLMTGDDVLAIEAYRLLVDEEGLIKTAPSALQSYTLALRHECLSALAKQYDDNGCQQQLLLATDNDHPEVVIKAARILARHQHPAILAKLKQLLVQTNDEKQQKAILRALGQLETSEVAVFLTDYVQQQQTARDFPLDVIYQIIANYRHVAVAETLLARFAKHEKEQSVLFKCLLTISGYDQPLYDHVYNSDDDETDAPPKWLEQQHPRHHALLVRLFDTLLQCKQAQRAQRLLAMLSWMPADIPDAALLKAVPIVEPDFLTPLTAVIGWRYYQRNQSAALAKGLLTLLTHQDAEIQFLAAEALSKGGQTQGKAVLLSSIEYLDNIEYRQRAVLALGESADPQVLECLLKLAKDKEHVLQAAAIEAIGHMGANDSDNKLFKLLRTALRDASEYSDMVLHALNGLRWLNTLSAWQLIAEKAQQDDYYYREHAIKCLRHWDSDYSRQVLLDLIQQNDDEDVVYVALKVAKHFWQPSKTAVNVVDFALLKGHCASLDDELVERISTYASISELFDLLTADFAINNDAYADDDDLADHQQMVASLRHALLQRESITEQEIVLPLNSTKVVSQSVAVQLLIRQQTLQATTKAALDTVLQHNYQQWSTLHAEIIQGQPQSKQQMADFDALQALLQSLLWCNVIHQIPCVTLVEILRQNEKAYVVLQEKILSALLTQQHSLVAEQRIAIEALLQSPVLMLRSLANQVLSQQDDSANNTVDLAWHYLVNKPQSATGDAYINAIQQAAASDAEQALALPLLIARGDSKTLITIADNQHYEETIRIGAIEALGRLADQQIEEKLNTLSKNDSDEDISKAAYRALRRSQRTRSRQNALSQ
jgi:ParB family chromosome partitioning protein